MGWGSGSTVFSSVIEAVKPVVEDVEDRKKIYRIVAEAFMSQDWDTLEECLGEDEAYDAVYAEIAEKYNFDQDEDE